MEFYFFLTFLQFYAILKKLLKNVSISDMPLVWNYAVKKEIHVSFFENNNNVLSSSNREKYTFVKPCTEIDKWTKRKSNIKCI